MLWQSSRRLKNRKIISVLVISIANPLLIGIYHENLLVKTFSCEGKTSDVLPVIFQEIDESYEIEKIYYVNGPGSYMSIKIAYLFLKTLSIVKKIPLLATKGFHFNENSPIKALGKKYFFNRQDDKIIIDFIQDLEQVKDFKLPQKLETNIFCEDILPSYNLPAV